jgi:hypothetical protein
MKLRRKEMLFGALNCYEVSKGLARMLGVESRDD